jgi:putative transposase
MVSPAAKRRALGRLLEKGVSRRLGCKVVGLSRNASRRGAVDRRPELRTRVLELSAANPRYGFRRVHALLVREGYLVNLKAVHRIWRQEGLSLTCRKRRRIQVETEPQEPITAPNQVWSIDFACEWLENRRQARIVGIGDAFTRENLLLKTRPSIRAGYLVRELEWLFLVQGKPAKLRFDNGPEFRSTKLTAWLEGQGVTAGFIEPGSPWQNGHIESFFGKLRDELLNMDIFPTGADLQAHMDDFQDHYNNRRPHSALGGLSPAQYKDMIKIKMEAEALTS